MCGSQLPLLLRQYREENMVKEILIDGRPVKFKATAAVPFLYRAKFARDIMKDLNKLNAAYEKAVKEKREFEIEDLSIFEQTAYIMARHADPENIPENIVDWLDEFETFSIYMVLPTILELWGLNQLTTTESKKKLAQVTGK